MYLQAWYLGVRCKSNPEQDKRVKKLIEKSWKDLGKMSQEEILVLIAFVILVLSWFFREPGFMKGKNSYHTRIGAYLFDENRILPRKIIFAQALMYLLSCYRITVVDQNL